MADDLADWFVHTVTVDGPPTDTPKGPVPGPTVDVQCFRDDKRRLVRSDTGAEVVSQTTLYAPLADAGKFPPGRWVDLGHRRAQVIGLAVRDAPGLDLPEHAEISLT